MKNSKIIFILAAFLFSNNAFAGGPWPQKKGNGYFKVSEWWTIFDQHFTDQGKIDPNVTTGIFNTSLYAEYGLTSRLTAVESFKNGDTAESITSTSIFANNTEFTSFGLEVAYYVTERVGLSAGFAGAFRGEVVAASPSYSVGVFYDLKR